MLLELVYLLLVASLASPSGELDDVSGDWSQCPRACKCKWASGKRTADCEAGGFTSLPLFPRPDLIQVLVMDHNPLKTLPPRAFHLAGLINVQKVYMKNCSLNDLHPTALGGLVILIELDLSENYIGEIAQGTFEGNVRLRKLRLSSNRLKSLASFPTLGHLRLLDLSWNHLSKLDTPTFVNLGQTLEVLHLNSNHFKRLSVRPFLSLHNLKSLRLEGNPWHCDCKLRDLWHWLQAKRLLLNSATCAAPPPLKGHSLNDLDSEEHLACAPIVSVPHPRVPVTKGGQALLPCKLEDGAEAAEVTWLREGVAIKANQSAVMYGQYYVIYSGRRWYNLSIENIEPPTSSDLYTCVAINEGGASEANVTLVHSPNVATYVGDGEVVVSWILIGGVASGIIVFFSLSLWLVLLVKKVRNRTPVVEAKSLTSNEEAKLSRSVASATSVEAMEAASFEEQQLRQTTALARAQRAKMRADMEGAELRSSSASTEADDLRGQRPDLLDCHQNSYMMMEMSQPAPPPFHPQLAPPPFHQHQPHQWRPNSVLLSQRPQINTSASLMTPGTTYGAKGYFNSLQRPLNSGFGGGGQLSDPDSGCFSSSGTASGGLKSPSFWFEAKQLHNLSSPMSSSASAASMTSTTYGTNNKLLAHTLENRKRVLQSLIREKSDTLV